MSLYDVQLATLSLTRCDASFGFTSSLVAGYYLSPSYLPSASDFAPLGAVQKALPSPSADSYLPSTLAKTLADRALERDPFSVHGICSGMAFLCALHISSTSVFRWHQVQLKRLVLGNPPRA
jgi:hypothetical protein